MITVTDIDAAFMDAEAKVAAWEEEFQATFYRPVLLAQAVREFLGMTDAERDMLRQLDPALHRALSGQAKKAAQRLRGVSDGNQAQTQRKPTYQPE